MGKKAVESLRSRGATDEPRVPAQSSVKPGSLDAIRKRRARKEAELLRNAGFCLFGVAAATWAGSLVVERAFTPSDFLSVEEVPVLTWTSQDSAAIFFEEFYGKRPVVIRGLLEGWSAKLWDPSAISDLCPAAQTPVYAYDTGGTEWASLKEVTTMKLSEYLQSEFGKPSIEVDAQGRGLYALEVSMRRECPGLLDAVRIPPPFTDDLLVRYYKKSAWPTLIAGPRGTRSGLHRDTHDLPFWMALLYGRKRWRVFADGDEFLSQDYHSESNGFTVDAFQPDFKGRRSLAKAKVYEHELKAGELIYIPSGAAHAAYNLEGTIAVSSNYLDSRGLERHFNGTCRQPLWRESSLCWAYTEQFLQHSVPPPVDELQERTFFEMYGFAGAKEWCGVFLEDLRQRLLTHPALLRNVKIVEDYCATKS